MAKKSDQEDLAQFNYRLPGEVETLGTQSKEDPNADVDETRKRIEKDQKRAEHQREDRLDDADGGEGLSPNKGMSDPKTQKEIDDENTWSKAR